MSSTTVKHKRVLLKLSGEILAGSNGFGICPEVIRYIVQEIKSITSLGVELGIVIGGGNIFRGVQLTSEGVKRVTGDYMGMLGTNINALALQDLLEQNDVPSRMMSAIEMREIAEPYIRRRAIRHLEKNRVLIFASGIGNPYFTTDTAASLRAMEIGADILLKGTKVDAVYDKDPEIFPDAKPYKNINYLDVLKKEIKVMDAAAVSLCKENNMPIIVFNIKKKGNLLNIINGSQIGTKVENKGD